MTIPRSLTALTSWSAEKHPHASLTPRLAHNTQSSVKSNEQPDNRTHSGEKMRATHCRYHPTWISMDRGLSSSVARRPKVCKLGRQKPLVTVKNESGNKCGSSSYQPKVTVFVNTVYCKTEELDISGPEDFVELPCFEGALEESSSFRDLSFFV